jgi:hypothetical protein
MTGYESKKAAAQAKLTQNAFDEWWDSNHNLNEINPCMYHSFEYWAWEGWHAALAQPAQEREALKLALESLNTVMWNGGGSCWEVDPDKIERAVAVIKEALAQPAQEPVAWAVYDKRGGSKSLHWSEQHSPNGDATMFDAIPLVPQRPWIGLTEENLKAGDEPYFVAWREGARWAEAYLKDKNT